MNFDVVVVGSGIAGLSFALKTAKLGHKVAIVTKKERSDTYKPCAGRHCQRH